MNQIKVVLAVFLLVIGQGFTADALAKKAPSIQQGADAEITFDGLHRVDHSKMDTAWAKPEIDLSQYDAIMFENAGIQYRPTKNYRRNDRSANAFPLSERQRSRLEKAVRSGFTSEFEKFEHYDVTTKAGSGTLKAVIGLTDVVSKVPPETASRSSYYLSDLGQAVLVMELRDSVTNEVLARVVDGKRVEPMMAQESNPVTNTSEVKRSVRQWGAIIRKRLDELHELGCVACESTQS